MMISKRNDEGHKSKTLIWTQREQKQHRHTQNVYIVCTYMYVLQRLLDNEFLVVLGR